MHAPDFALVAAYLAVVLWLGRRTAAGPRTQEGFFLGGRRLGRLYQFFLNFGNTTEANTAVSTVSLVYREGASGAWLPLQMVFVNPYYWFMNVWFRRVRLLTTAEMFEVRLLSPGLARVYAVFQVGVAILGLGFGNFIAYKILVAIVPGLDPLAFYSGYTAIIGLYLILGGLAGMVRNQVFQGLLILTFSLMLLPFGWRALGSVPLRQRIPARMFDLLGAPGGEQVTWYALLALLAVSLVQINANVVNMGLGGSARDEFAARLGAVSGTFGKRVMIVLWAFLGLAAAGLRQGPDRLADPDLAWGVLSRQLLGPGLLGLMVAGVLAANMASTASKTMAVSALWVRNLRPAAALRSGEAGAVRAGRLGVAAVLAASVVAALCMDRTVTVLKLVLTINLPFGAAVLLMLFWRGLTRPAAWWGILLSMVVVFVLPFALQAVPSVAAGVPGFFETAARPDPAGPLVGSGRFNLEAWLLWRAGLPLAGSSRSTLLSAQFLFDAIFPFVVLIGVSLLTRPPPEETVDRFFGIMKTPVGATPELEAEAMAETLRSPRRFDHQKIFPGSSWEFTRWDRTDTGGFLACCAVSGAIVLLFWLALRSLR